MGILGECMLDVLSFLNNRPEKYEVEITNDVLKGDYPDDVINTTMRSLMLYGYITGHSYFSSYFASGLTEQGRKFLEEHDQ